MSESVEEQSAKIREEFNKIDTDGTGKIACKEVENLLKNLEIEFTEEQLQEILTKSTIKESDKVTFDKFLSIYNEFLKDERTKEDFIAALQAFDEDHDGKITRDELTMMLDNLGESITQEDQNELISQADPENTGFIEFEFLVDLLMKT